MTLSWTEAGDTIQVLHDGAILGSVPIDQQHQLPGELPTCTVRSFRNQDGKLTQILVRAVLTSATTDAPQAPGKSTV